MRSQYLTSIDVPIKTRQKSIECQPDLIDRKSRKVLTTRKRILTLQYDSVKPQLPILHNKPLFKLSHLKTESSGEEHVLKLSPLARFPISTKQKTVSDEYEDYANHIANNSQILQIKQQRRNLFLEQNIVKPLKPINVFFNAYRLEKLKEQNSKELFMKQYDYTIEDWVKFGDRFPKDHIRVRLLGKGGFSMIWLSEHTKTRERFALKQIPSSNVYQTHTKEIKFCNQFFEHGGKVREQYDYHPGVHSLIKLIKYETTSNDNWLFYELGGFSIGTQLYDFSSNIFESKKVYKLQVQKLTKIFQKQKHQIYKFVQKIAESIDLLQAHDIVHSDIKSENILIMYDQSSEGWNLKLIDYGSSFAFSKLQSQFSMATPEYMCPELLNFIIVENGQKRVLSQTIDKSYDRPWVIDVWSLGCVLLEIVSGIPLWMSLETLVMDSNGTPKLDTGLFAVKGRLFDQIIQKQISVCSNLKEYLQQRIYSGIELDERLMQLFQGMLQINPAKRMHPQQIIKFCQVFN